MTLITNEIKEKIEQLVIRNKHAKFLVCAVQEAEKYIEQNQKMLIGIEEGLKELEKHGDKFKISKDLMLSKIKELNGALKHNKFERDRYFSHLMNILNKEENFVHKAE